MIDRRDNGLYVWGASMTKGGHRINDILNVLPSDVAPAALGEVVLTTWHASRVTSLKDPAPGNPRAHYILLERAGVHTDEQYVRGTRHVMVGKWWGLGQNVYQPRGSLNVTPCRNLGPKGFVPIEGAVIEIEVGEATPQRVGEAVLEALEIAR